MKKRNPNRISELRLKLRWSQSKLAEKVDAHWVTVSKLERGQMRLTQEWMERIGKVLGVDPAELMPDPPLLRTVYAHRVINNRGIIVDDYSSNGEEIYAVPFEVEMGSANPNSTVWYIAGTECFTPFIRTGDLMRFTYQSELSIEKALHNVCLIETDEEPSKKIVGVPSRGSDQLHIDISIYGGSTILNVRVREIAVLSMTILNPKFVHDEDGYPGP